jgi:DNA polymerase III sliding clamp (beta) subunit (PCNA family)
MQDLSLMNDPFLLLPANLGELARATAKPHRGRPAMSGVYLEVCEDEYEAVATDGRQLAMVRGRATADPLSFPACEALAELPPSRDSAVIPRDQWQEAFRGAPKGGEVAVHLGQSAAVLCTSDGDEEQARRAPNVEGKFPDYRSVLPTKEPVVRIRFDPDLLLNLVKIARSFSAGPDKGGVTLEVWAADKPITLKCGTEEQQFTGLLMPLA